MTPFRRETERLVLRDYVDADVARIQLYAGDPEFSKYEAWGPNTLDDTRAFVARCLEYAAQPDRFVWELAIAWKATDEHVGGVRIGREARHADVATLGWSVNPAFQGRGVATEAAAALIRFGFDELGLRAIGATCDARNVASHRVMEKLGMRRVALIRDDREIKGRLRDTLRYEIVRGA